MLQIYLVGGAVRDTLLGLPVTDRDWVVVGATAAQMRQLGYRPVGKDFPVFLHPKTQEEYALARTERKDGHGYKGFNIYASPEVTLEQDLLRRDLTINAIAAAVAADGKWQLIDPFNGQADLQQGWLRHVSPAFAEDPLRVLRVARFAARYPDFKVAPETMQLMQQMVQQQELQHLAAERVWQELAKGLATAQVWRMFDILQQTGALTIIWPELAQFYAQLEQAKRLVSLWQQPTMAALSVELRAALLLWLTLPATATKSQQLASNQQIAQRLRLPSQVAELSRNLIGLVPLLKQLAKGPLDAERLMQLYQQADALRRPQRFEQLLDICQNLALYLGIEALQLANLIEQIKLIFAELQQFSISDIIAAAGEQQLAGPQLAAAILQARTNRIAELLAKATRA